MARPRKRVLLQLDFGGPIVNDALIERTRMRTALRAARQSGLLLQMKRNLNKIDPFLSIELDLVSRKDFMKAYDRGKSHLKRISKGAEAYDDVNRTAATLLEAIKAKDWRWVKGIDYFDLTAGIGKKTRMAFFRKFAGPVRAATERSVDKEAFATIARIVQRAKANGKRIRVDIVTDNNPILYRTAFQTALSKQARVFAIESGQSLPKTRYRKNPKSAVGRIIRATTLLFSPAGKSRAYISGENWGNKQDPRTWKKILKDRNVRKGEKVIFVDDSLKKLKGFYDGTNAFGAKPVAVWLDLKKEGQINLVGTQTAGGFQHFTIHSIKQLEQIMEI